MPNPVLERPRWARRDLAMQLTGVSKMRLLALVNEGTVRARKMDSAAKNSCVFSAVDIEEWLANEARPAGPFVLPKPV